MPEKKKKRMKKILDTGQGGFHCSVCGTYGVGIINVKTAAGEFGFCDKCIIRVGTILTDLAMEQIKTEQGTRIGNLIRRILVKFNA